MNKIDIKSLNRKELEELLVSMGEKSFRSRQVYGWMHQRLVSSFGEMTDISKKLQEKLLSILHLPELIL